MEVTVASSDATVWTEVLVPATTGSNVPSAALVDLPSAGSGGVGLRPPTTQVLGTSPYIVWRIHEESPKTLELMELSLDKAVRNSGLRFTFEFPLCPFASVTLSSVRSSQWFIYEVVTLTVTGVLCTIFLKVARAAHSRFGMTQQSVIQRDLSAQLYGLRRVTSFAASSDTLCIGGQNGVVIWLHIGFRAEGNDHVFELKELEGGLSRLWGGLSLRGKTAAAVKSLAIQQVSGASLLIVLHEDGSLRVWDLAQHIRQFHHVVVPPAELATSMPTQIWVEDTYVLGQGLKLALLLGGNSSGSDQAAAILVGTLHVAHAEGGIRLTEFSVQKNFHVGQGSVLNCKLLQGTIWILHKSNNNGGQCELLSASLDDDSLALQSCPLQESVVEEQLFQYSPDACDDLLFSLNHIGMESSEMMHDAVPSLFLRRLLQPGVRQHHALKEVLRGRKRRLSDFEIGSLTLDGLRKEIKSAIDSEPLSCRRYIQEWVNLSRNYVEAWRLSNSPYVLFADAAAGSVGLVRKNSISVIRHLTRLEQIVSKGVKDPILALPADWEGVPSDPMVITALMRCMENISRHLGDSALGVFHEALMRPEAYPFQSLTQSFLLVLDLGYSSLDTAQESAEFGVDEIRTKVQSQNQRQRKFSLHMLQCLHSMRALAGSWEAALDIICKYVQYLVLPTNTGIPGANSADAFPLGSVFTKMLSHASSQISWTHFEGSRNLLLLLSYMVKVQGQVGLTSNDVTRIQLHILPHVQESLAVSFLLHWLTVSFAEVPPSEDCSLQLSSLQIDNGSRGEKVQSERLGAGELALAEILASAFLETTTAKVQGGNEKMDFLPGPEKLQKDVRRFVGWLLIGESSDESTLSFSGRAITLSSILLQHGQYGNLESFLNAVEHFSTQQQLSQGVGSLNGEWSARLHLLGICSLAKAQSLLEKNTREKHVGDAIQCFFRAASGLGEANKVLQSLFFVTGVQQQLPGRGAAAAWRLQYFEWVMQLFDQYNLGEGACQFAYAALEQVDEAVRVSVIENSEGGSSTVGAAIKGRLWANVFKFSLDLELYGNAYCAIISNPDEESKDTCLRRFIIVLCDHRVSLTLCGNELPYGVLFSRVEEELVLKAQNSELTVKANLYKLLYALHIHHHNVARAAGFMYQYALSIREQGMPKSRDHALSLLQEELDALAAAINALQLVEPYNGFVSCGVDWPSSTKRRRVSADRFSKSKALGERSKVVECDQLVKEHAFTLARVQLIHADMKHTSLGPNIETSDLVVLLLQHGLYEMAFSLVFLFWKESSQKRELEKVFEIMARKCCTLQMQVGSAGHLKFSDDFQLALTLPSDSSSPGEEDGEEANDLSLEFRRQHSKLPLTAAAKGAWEALKSALEKYGDVHPKLKTVVAETILSVDQDMELPIWLIDSFKDVKDARGMSATNRVADPAALLRIYLDHGRYMEATYLLLEYLQASTRLRPSDVFKRKQACGVWFPYTLVDRLIRCLAELRVSSGHAASQNEKLRISLQNAVLHHFDRIKRDSDDVKVLAENASTGSYKGFAV